MKFHPVPTIPRELIEAAESGELVVFVGAGVSRLIKCPSWEQFADSVLKQLVPKHIDHYQFSQIATIKDPRKRLSIAKIIAQESDVAIDYGPIFEVTPTANNIYETLNTLECPFITTNYELNLKPECSKPKGEDEWRFYQRGHLLGAHLDQAGNVIHLHGCIKDPTSMIVTMRDYLDHYSTAAVQTFLRELFERKTVLFMGYGLEEIEVLEYIMRQGGSVNSEPPRIRRFILQGFFNADEPLFKFLHEYYLQSFQCELIPFPKDHKDYEQLVDLVVEWVKSLTFRRMELADEVERLEEEIRG